MIDGRFDAFSTPGARLGEAAPNSDDGLPNLRVSGEPPEQSVRIEEQPHAGERVVDALAAFVAEFPTFRLHSRTLIAEATNDVLVSAASLWESQVKVRIGKLRANLQDILAELRNQAFDLLEIAPAHLIALGALPRHHADPWNHLLIAQANVEGAIFMSQDGHTPSYPVTYMTCSGSALPTRGGAPAS